MTPHPTSNEYARLLIWTLLSCDRKTTKETHQDPLLKLLGYSPLSPYSLGSSSK